MGQPWADPAWQGPQFCCDGAGQGAGCDPWCDRADPVQHAQFVQTQHLGYVDFSVTGGSAFGYQCDDPRCCGDDDDDYSADFEDWQDHW